MPPARNAATQPPAAGAPATRRARRRPTASSARRRGAPILVGRGADRNDELTFKVARGNDLWLHTRDVPGAHVVVPLAGRPVDGETLLDAATLAAHHSNARGEAQVDVIYVAAQTRAQAARRAARARHALGRQDLRVRLEPARLERLLASRVDEDR